MGIFQNNLMGAAAAAASAGGADFYDYQIANSCRFGVVNSYLTRAISGVTDNTQNTISFWVKRSRISGSAANGRQPVMGNSGGAGQLEFLDADTFRYASYGKLESNVQLFRDTSAWYHIHIYRSTSDGGGAIYVNGVQVSLTTNTAGSDGIFQNGQSLQIGASNNGSTVFDGYIAEVYGIYDQNIAHTEFGEFKNGVWIPKNAASAITFGTHDFYLKFESSTDLGNDSSGNNNDFTATNMSAHDQMLDSPTFNSSSNGGNFATLGGLEKNSGGFTISEGNLKYAVSTNNRGFIASQGVPESGKYYWEVRVTQFGGSEDQIFLGVCVPDKMRSNLTASRGGADVSGAGGYTVDNYNGRAMLDGVAQSNDAIGTARSVPQTFGIAIDRDNNTFKWTYDGSTYSSTYTIPSSGVLAPYIGSGGGSNTASGVFNFGADSTFAGLVTAGGNADGNGYGDFSLAVPSGYVALCAANLPVAAEVDPAQTDDNYPQKMFQALTYTGNASNSRSITTRFDPDVMWFKRTDGAKAWNNYSKTQGIGDTSYYQQFDSTAYDGYNSGSYKGVISTASTSMTIGAVDYINGSGLEYVSYLFNMGGSQATNTDGSVTSYIYNSGAGMSVGKYTGESATRTVGHGLGVAPTYIIVKSIGAARNWAVYYGDNTEALQLNNTNATDVGVYWANTSPTSSVFTVGDSSETGKSEQYMFMAFANTEGFIKAGSYVGNGDGSNGPFVYTGFKPAFLLVKKLTVNNWRLQDSARDPYNPVYHMLAPNSTAGEDAYTDGTDYNDFLSNGFKLARGGDAVNWNASGATYVYLSFAENPFKYATAR